MTRTGLVLGAGGILGSAWMTGALPAVQQRIGRPGMARGWQQGRRQ